MFTIGTANLAYLLTDALATCETDPEAMLPGVHVATHRAAGFGDEPGRVDLIALTSTNGHVVGHTFDVVDGQVTASVWPPVQALTVLAICKGLAKAGGKDHTVDVEVVEQVPDGEPSGDETPAHPGYVVTVRETPALFESDTEFTFHAEHEGRFPLGMVAKVLRPELDGEAGSVGPELLWSPAVLAPLTAIGRRRKSEIRFYRVPGRDAQVVQIGGTWLGAAMPMKPVPGEERTEPSIDALLPAVVDG